MTLEEKIAHLQETVMTEARSEGNAIIDNHKKALESLFEKHKKEATAQSEVRIKSETLRARRQVNQAAAKAETELKRALGKTQNELKVRLFDEVKELLTDFTQTAEAARFAAGEEMTIYISPSDKEKQTELEKRTGMTITISEYDFMGGMRAVIRGRNILIDHSFQAAVDYEYHQFSFAAGGAGIE